MLRKLIYTLLIIATAEVNLAQTVTVHGGSLIVASGTSLIIISGPATLINNAGGEIINAGTITVGGEFKNNGTSTVDNSGIIYVGGDFFNNGSNNVFINRDKVGLVELNGSTTQILKGNTFFENLTINNTAAGTAISFWDDQTVENTTTLTDGVVTTNANTLISSCVTGSTITGYSNASFVNGNIRKHVSYSSCLDFDGANDYVDIGDNIEGLTTLTFEGWVYYASGGSSTYDEIFSKNLVNTLSIYRGGGDKLLFQLGTGAAWFDGGAITSTSSIATDTWTHIAVTWDEATTTVNMYINGALDKTSSHTHSGGSVMGSNTNSRGLGSYSPPAGELFQGKIDEFRVWNVVRSQTEIEHLMTGMPSTTSTGLLAYYRFEDGTAASSSTLTDVTTNTFDGTLTNMDNTNDWVSNTYHNTYPLPLGNGTATTNYYLAEMEVTALTAGSFTYLDTQFATLVTGGTLSITEETTIYTGIGPEGEWNIIPDNAPTSIAFDMDAYVTNYSGLTDNQFTVVNRADGSADAADWACTPCGFSASPAAGINANGTGGRLVAGGYASRRGFSASGKFGIALTGAPIGPLPIELLSFNAFLEDSNVKLEWETAAEINNDYFTIERSNDGHTWEVVNNTDGAGNSTTTIQYSTFDYHPYNISYYRLKQTDYDGQFKYSKIININQHEITASDLKIYPNPFSNTTTIRSSTQFFNATLTLTNSMGIIVRQVKNIFGYTIDISKNHLPNGIYYFTVIESSNEVASNKLIIID